MWYEVSITNIEFNCDDIKNVAKTICRWFPYNKGGSNIKWYGNYEYIVDWFNDGYEIKNYKNEDGKVSSRPQKLQYYFKSGITWSLTSAGRFGARYRIAGSIFDINGMTFFVGDIDNTYYILGLLNSIVTYKILKTINPTMANQAGDINQLPIKIINDDQVKKQIEIIARTNVELSKKDWDSFEISWDFKKHPLV